MRKRFLCIVCILAMLLNGIPIYAAEETNQIIEETSLEMEEEDQSLEEIKSEAEEPASEAAVPAAQTAESQKITEVTLPCNYTELYYGKNLNITAPTFYDSLECKIDGEDATVSGITWTSNDYTADTEGVYTFSAVAPSGYAFEGPAPTITVRVRKSTVNGLQNRTGYFFSSYTENPSGLYATALNSGDSSKPTAIKDATGLNKIFANNASNTIKLVGGVDHTGDTVGKAYAENPKNLKGELRLEGTTIHSMYGGSFGNWFQGTTDIYVKNGTLTDGLYAGSVNGDSTGTTNIYLSGNSSIEKLYVGSIYKKDAKVSSSGTIVGKQDVFYKGTANIYIAEDFTGTIGTFDVAEGAENHAVANIYLPATYSGSLPASMRSGGTVRVYRDDLLVKTELTGVTYDGASEIIVALGTAKSEINLDGTLTLTVEDGIYTETDITWTDNGYNADEEGVYTFTPVLSDCYEVASGLTMPTVTVKVENGHVERMEEVKLPCNYTELYYGENLQITSSTFYYTLECKIDGKDATVSGITWTSNDYTADKEGVYTFSAVAPSGYAFEGPAPTITVRVRKSTANGLQNRTGYFFSSYTENPSGLYATALNSGDSSKPTAIKDATGLNKIFANNASNTIKLVGGVDHTGDTVGKAYAANPKDLQGELRLEGTTIHSMYGGSFGNWFQGTTDIYVKNGTLTDGLYAGSVNGDSTGTTNIYLSGNSSIEKLYVGSIYKKDAKVSSKGDIVGKQDVSYTGTANIYIAEDFTGKIETIEAATGEKDAVTANIYYSGNTSLKFPAIKGGSQITLFKDEAEVTKNVTSVPYEGEELKKVSVNTSIENLQLLDTLKIICGDITYIEDHVEWECKEGYTPGTEGYYIFTPKLPDCYIVSDSSVLPTVRILVKSGVDTIEAVSLPEEYTELYAKLAITSPQFYDTLTCKINGTDTKVYGFTWTSTDYNAGTEGIYTFTANAPDGYQFKDGFVPTIRVRVREAAEDKNNVGAIDRFGHFFSNDKSDIEQITGFYGAAIPGINDSSKTRVVDLTGYNPIRSADTSNNIRLVGGVDYAVNEKLAGTELGNRYAENPTKLSSKIGLYGAKMHSMYGGSYGNIFKGTTDIYMTGGVLTKGIYAGSINGDFDGTTNIYLSGDCTVPELYLGSIYSKDATHIYQGTTVGKQAVAYKGTVNVYIADDFTGSIGKIVVPDGAGDEIAANIYMSSACGFDIFSVGYEGATLYMDGKDASKYMSEVRYDGEDFIVVPKGTDKKDISFQGTLTLVYGGKEYTETKVEWSCSSYDANTLGEYVFKPELPSSYEPNNTPELPTVKVLVTEEGGIAIESIDVGICLETRIPEGITKLNLPEKAVVTYQYNGQSHKSEIEIAYDTSSYKPEKGNYILSVGKVEKAYTLSEAIAKTAELKVEVADVKNQKTDNSYFFENAMLAVWAKDRGDYAITDVSQLYTYYEHVSVIDDLKLSGKNPMLHIDSPLVYVENEITFCDIIGAAKAVTATPLVTKIRTQSPELVTVNDVLLKDFENKTVTAVSGERVGDDELGTFYFNGIPGILARGEDGGTYAYRSYDMKKLSEQNLAGWDVCGGAFGKDSTIDTANIRFESGTVYRLFGGGQGSVKNATLVLDGGAVAWASYGGAIEKGIVEKAVIVYEYGDSKRKAYTGGEEGSVLGIENKTYKEGEYAAEVYLFDCAIQYVTLGGKRGVIYGNIRYEQYGGSLLEIYSGGYKADHYGDVDITVYGGLWEKLFKQQDTHKGNANLKLYNAIHREEFIEYPVFNKENESGYTQKVTYFERPDSFRFIQYDDQRDKITDTSKDEGKLVVRFLETKVDDGFDKGTVKIRDGTGDSMYITFPNGQNMLIDTGKKEGGKFIVQDLKDLGVETLDYLVITHDHNDHIGGLEAVSEAFGIKNLLYQKYNTNELMDTVAAVENANKQLLKAGDVLVIGEGEQQVRFDVIGPDDELITDIKENGNFDVNQTSVAMVMTYGESKAFFGGDSLYENEKAWVKDSKITELISGCQLLKLNHHGIFNANTPEFLAVVNAEKYVITQMREYGTQLGQAVAQLQGAFGVTLDDIYATGRQGMIKAVVEKDGTLNMSCQYVTPVSAPEPTPTPEPTTPDTGSEDGADNNIAQVPSVLTETIDTAIKPQEKLAEQSDVKPVKGEENDISTTTNAPLDTPLDKSEVKDSDEKEEEHAGAVSEIDDGITTEAGDKTENPGIGGYRIIAAMAVIAVIVVYLKKRNVDSKKE